MHDPGANYPCNEIPVEWLVGASFKLCGWQWGAILACAPDPTGDALPVPGHGRTSAVLDAALQEWERDMETLRTGIVTLWSKHFAADR